MNRTTRTPNSRQSHHPPITTDYLFNLKLGSSYLDDQISSLNSKEPRFIQTLSTVTSVPSLHQNHSYDNSIYAKAQTYPTKNPANMSRTTPTNHVQNNYHHIATTIVPTPNHLRREGCQALGLEADEMNEHVVRPSCESIADKRLPMRSPNKRTLSDVHFSFVNALNNTIDAAPSLHPDQPLPKPRISSYSRTTLDRQVDSRLSMYNFNLNNSFNHHEIDKKKDSLLTPEILRALIKFLSLKDVLNFKSLCFEFRNQKKYKKIFEKQITHLLIQGVSPQEQYAYWNSCINFKHLKVHHPFSFTSKFVKNCSYIKDICSDLDRTLPDYGKFDTKEGRSSLLRVLVALSNTVKDVGYIQGLNSIAGVALTCLKEEETFWMLLYMMEKLNVKDILNESFTRINILNYQLQTFLDNYLPELAAYLEENGMVWKHITISWFITLFAQYLSFHNVIKLWNLFFIKGNTFLIQFALGVLSHYKEIILNSEIDNFGQFLNDKINQIPEYSSIIFSKALEFKVTKRLMTDLETHYKNGEPQLRLVRGHTNKLYWQAIEKKVNIQKDVPQSLNELDLSSSDQQEMSWNNSSKTAKTEGSMNSLSSHRNSVPLIRSLFDVVTKELPETVKQMFTPQQRRRPILKSSNSSRNIRANPTKAETIKSLQELGKFKKMHSTPENYDWEHGRCATEPDGFIRPLEMSRILEEEEEIKKENMRRALKFLEGGRVETECGDTTTRNRHTPLKKRKNDIFKEANHTGFTNDSMLLLSFNGTPLSTLSSAQQKYTVDLTGQNSRRKSALVNHSDINALFEQSQIDFYQIPVNRDPLIHNRHNISHTDGRKQTAKTLTNLSTQNTSSYHYDYRYHNKML